MIYHGKNHTIVSLYNRALVVCNLLRFYGIAFDDSFVNVKFTNETCNNGNIIIQTVLKVTVINAILYFTIILHTWLHKYINNFKIFIVYLSSLNYIFNTWCI